MKKIVRKNFIVIVVLICAILAEVIIAEVSLRGSDTALAGLKQDMQTLRENHPDGLEDVEGYAYLIQGIGYGLGTFGVLLVRFLLVYLPLIYAAILTVLTVFAAFGLGREQTKTPYKIVMGVSLFWILLGMLPIGSLLFACDGGISAVVFGAYLLYSLFLLIYCGINTFRNIS